MPDTNEGTVAAGTDGHDQAPHDLLAEQTVLGAVMTSTDAIIDVVELLAPSDFHQPGHQIVYDAVLEFYGTGQAGGPTAVVELLRKRDLLEQAGGEEYVRALPSRVAKTTNAPSCAEIVRKKALLRRLVRAGVRIGELARVADRNEVAADEVIGSTNAELASAVRGHDQEYSADMVDMLRALMDDLEARTSPEQDTSGIPTGFFDLDELTDGLPGGSLTVIGAGPGIGSTTLALDFARFAALRKGIGAAFLTLTDTTQSITQRVISAEARIRLADLRSGRMDDHDWTRLARRVSDISEKPLMVTPVKNPDVTSVLFAAQDLVWRQGARLVVIDSLHMLTARRELRYENREREVAEITRRLKRFALTTNTVVVVTAQLSTNPGPRQPIPPRPSLADLRDSGTIAHVADLVLLIDRPDGWDRDSLRAGEADLIVAKNNNGVTTTLTVAHQLHYCRFADLAQG